jgi:serine-type D-Ala-D-Ala carboxypeptidase/endopeptidase (penicillin-binding protein 4)
MNDMARVCLVLLLALPAMGQAIQESPPVRGAAQDSVAALQERLRNHLAQARFARAAWGVKVVSLQTGNVLFEHDAEKLLKPASNAKLYTGALMLDRFGPEYRIKTSVYASAKPAPDGTLSGDLIVFGRGDPSFSARFAPGTNALARLADAIVRAGVKRIEGRLIGDQSFFRGPPFGTGWNWDDLRYYYGAEVSSLSVEDNVIDLVIRPGPEIGAPCRIFSKQENGWLIWSNRTTTVGEGGPRSIQLSRALGGNVVYARGTIPMNGAAHIDAITVHDPAGLFVHWLSQELSARKVVITGAAQTVNALDREAAPLRLAGLVELATVESRPMSELVQQMMKPSQNLYAQLLLLHAGAQLARGERHDTTEQAGLAAMAGFLADLEIPPGTVLLEEGAGLSRGALLTPGATVLLLEKMHGHRHGALFRDSLPLASVEGTLRNRLHNTAAARNARAKTGTLRFVSALSGYVASAAGEPLAFSIMLNNYDARSAAFSGRAQVDELLVMLAEFSGHSGGN